MMNSLVALGKVLTLNFKVIIRIYFHYNIEVIVWFKTTVRKEKKKARDCVWEWGGGEMKG